MNAIGATKRARLSGAGARAVSLAFLSVLAVAMVVAVAILVGGSGSARGAAPGTDSSGFVPAVTPAGQLYLNQSELSHSLGQLSPYISLYATFNNSTVHKLPYANTAEPTGFYAWVTVNASYKLHGDPKDLLQFVNVTTANGTTLKTGATGFKVTGAEALWLDYIEYLYVDYSWTLSAPGTSFASSAGPTALLVNETRPGHTTSWLNTTETFSDGVLALAIPANYTFDLALPATFDGTATSPQYGETSTPVYSFSVQVEVTPSAKTVKVPGVYVTGPGTEGWSNYTATYTESNATSYSTAGSFYAGTLTFFGYVETFWWAAAFVIVFVAVIVLAKRDRRGKRR